MLGATPTVRTRLVVLVLGVVIPMIVISAGCAALLWNSTRDSVQRELLSRAQAVAARAEREIEAGRGSLQALATSPSLQDGDLRRFYDQVTRTPRSGGTNIGLSNASGQMLLSTRFPFGAVLQPRGDLDSLRQVFDVRKTRVSNLYVGQLEQETLVAIDVPIIRDGQVIYDLRMGFQAKIFSDLIRPINPPESEWAVGLLDGEMSVIARIPENAVPVGSKISPVAAQAIFSGGSSGIFSSPGFDGHQLLVGYLRLPGTDWTAIASIQVTAVRAKLWHSLLAVATGGGILLLFGLLAAMHQARRIANSIGDLAKVPASLIPGGLREVEAVASSLADAAADRERTEAALRGRDARLRLAFETARLGAWEIDLSTARHQWDEPLAALLGLPPEQATEAAYDWLEVVHPGDRDRVVRALRAAAAEGLAYAEEFRVRRLDGVERIFMSHGALVAPGRMVGVAQDVTEIRAAEVSARAALAELNAIYDSAPVGLCVLDTEMRWVRINAELANLNRMPVSAYIGRKVRDLLPEIAAGLEATLRHVLATGQPAINQEIVGETPAQPGIKRVWQTSWLPLRNGAGVVVAVNVVVQEVTRRRATERALADSEARFRAITDAMPQMVWSTRPDGYHDYHNQRWYDLTGTTPEQVTGDGWFPLVHPEDRERVWSRWRHSVATGESHEVEYRLRMADGSYLWTLSRALPVREPKTGAILRWFGTCTDIEETVAARDALARSREDLERLAAERTRDLEVTQVRLAQAQRVEALGLIAGGIAHDFNNLLQIIQGSSDLIDRLPGDAADVRRHAREILAAADRGAAITRRLLTFSRRGDLRAEPVDARTLLTAMHDILARTLGDAIKVSVDVPDGLPPLLADKGQLETVLVNLATNGRDAMAGRGMLTLAASAETPSNDRSAGDGAAGAGHAGDPGNLKAGPYIRISVSDTGTGMDAATLARASEPFFTTKPVGRGTGLGLAMARGFALQSGGDFAIESTPGAGTTVSLWLPVAEQTIPEAAPRGELGIDASGEPDARLLVVDDDEGVLDVITEQLQASGYIVRSVGSGSAALALIDTGEPVDVLVTDLSMPDMDGVNLIEEAQRRRPGLPAILLTGFAAANVAEIDAGATISGTVALLHKPINARALAQQVAVLLKTATSGQSRIC